MGNDDQKLILGYLTKKLDDLLGCRGVKVSGRLIGKDDGAVLGKSAGNDCSLLLTARKLTSLLLYVRGKTDAANKLHRSLPTRLFVLDVHKCQLDVLQNCKTFDNVVVLKNEGNIFLSVFLPFGL